MALPLYPLTASQRMLLQAMDEFGTAQVLTIGVCISMRAPLDFSLLKKCLTEEVRRLACLRIQFTSAQDEIRQYIVPESCPDITYENLKDKSDTEIKALMTRWSAMGFEHEDAPLLRFVMVSLPHGWNGVYLCIDHRIMDSCGLVYMMNDTLQLYCHYLYGAPIPAMPASCEDVLLADLERENDPLRREKDRAFWRQLLTTDEPIYTDINGPGILARSRLRHGSPDLRAADRIIQPMDGDMARFTLPKKEADRLERYCKEHSVSMANLLLMSMRTALSLLNDGEEDVTIRNYVSRRAARKSRTCGGCRIHCYPCRTVIPPETSFLDGIRQIKTYQSGVYRHSDFDPACVEQMMAEAYGLPPLTTYEGAALTCQLLPLSPVNPRLRHIPVNVEWFSSGADIQKLYLTVMQEPLAKGLDFYFKYQTAELEAEEVRGFFELLCEVMSLGTRNTGIGVGEVMRGLT